MITIINNNVIIKIYSAFTEILFLGPLVPPYHRITFIWNAVA